jgi:hypothetical protein
MVKILWITGTVLVWVAVMPLWWWLEMYLLRTGRKPITKGMVRRAGVDTFLWPLKAAAMIVFVPLITLAVLVSGGLNLLAKLPGLRWFYEGDD